MTETTAAVSVGNFNQEARTTLTPGKVGDRITIKIDDQQEYRIKILADGTLEIMSENFINSNLSIRPVVSNVVTIKGVERA